MQQFTDKKSDFGKWLLNGGWPISRGQTVLLKEEETDANI